MPKSLLQSFLAACALLASVSVMAQTVTDIPLSDADVKIKTAGQTAAQTAPGQQLDKVAAAVAVGDLAHDQRGKRQTADSRNKVCRDGDKRENNDLIHLQNADERHAQHHIEKGVEQRVQRFPDAVKASGVVGLLDGKA